METYIGVLLVFVFSVIVHEAGHAFTAMAMGYKLKKFYIGIPFEREVRGIKITTNIFKKKVGDIEFGISVLLLGGAVDFHDLDDAPLWKFFLVVAYGPVASLLLGFIPLLLYYNFETAFYVSQIIVAVVISTLGQFVSGGLPTEQIVGPVGAMNQMAAFVTEYNNGLVLLLVVLNLSFFATNMIPIPAIDGGHLLFSTIDTITKKKYTKLLSKITQVSWYLLMAFMIIVMTKDLW